MSIMETRGGVPHVRRIQFDTTGRKHLFKGKSKWLCIRATTFPAIVYFNEDDFTAANTNYILVPVSAAATPYGEWSGPVETDAIWIKGSGGSTDIELVVTKRLN